MDQVQFLEKLTEKFSEFLRTLIVYRVQLHYMFMFLIFGSLFIALFLSIQPDAICQKLILLRNFYFLSFAILNLDILYCKLNNIPSIYHSNSEIPLYACFFIFVLLISITVKFIFSIPELVNIPITPILSGLLFVVFYLSVFVKDRYEHYGVVSILTLLTQVSLLVFIHLTYLNFNEVRVKYHRLKSQLEKSMARTENIINTNKAQIEFFKKHFCDALFKTFFSNNFEQTANRNKLKEIGNTFSTHFDSFYDEAMKAHFFIQKYEQRFQISSIYRIFLIKMENKSLLEIIDIFEEMIEKLSEDFILVESIVHKIKTELYKALFLDSESRHNYITKRIANCKRRIENVNNYFRHNGLWEPRRLFEHMSSIDEDEESLIGKVIDNENRFMTGRAVNDKYRSWTGSQTLDGEESLIEKGIDDKNRFMIGRAIDNENRFMIGNQTLNEEDIPIEKVIDNENRFMIGNQTLNEEDIPIEKVIDNENRFMTGSQKKSKRTSSFSDIREKIDLDVFDQSHDNVFTDVPKRTLPRNFSFESSIRLRERPVVDIRDLEDERIKLEKYQEGIDELISKIAELKSQFDESLRSMVLKDSIEKDLNEINNLMDSYLRLVELYDELESVLKNCKSKLLKIGFLCE